jgi:2-hydroxy-3-keto-5-methylthiopentenyl-1-phosphate phosphatase
MDYQVTPEQNQKMLRLRHYLAMYHLDEATDEDAGHYRQLCFCILQDLVDSLQERDCNFSQYEDTINGIITL